MLPLTIGTKVERIELRRGVPVGGHGQKGSVVDVTDDRIRIRWFNADGTSDRRTWVARSAEGSRWQRLPNEAQS